MMPALAPNGRSLGHPGFGPVWKAAEQLQMAIGLHIVFHPHYVGNDWYRDRDPGFAFVSMNCLQDPRRPLLPLYMTVSSNAFLTYTWQQSKPAAAG